jgi:hypothetical protein
MAWVQLGPYGCGGNVSTIRQSQTDALPASEGWWSNHSATRLPIPLSAVAPTYDLCSPQPGHEQTPGAAGYNCWIHARNKSEVARRLALQLLHSAPPGIGATQALRSIVAEEEYSGAVVKSATLIPAAGGRSPRATLTLDHADGLRLSPAQGCVQCCNQVRKAALKRSARSLPFARWCNAFSHPRSSRAQTATLARLQNGSRLIAVFEVANRRGIWLPAIGSVESVGPGDTATVLVTPQGHAATVSNDWLAAVRYAMLDEPECALYNAASLPALPFELPVPWGRPAGGPSAGGRGRQPRE